MTSSRATDVSSGLSQACSYCGELTNCGVTASCALAPTRSAARPQPGNARSARSASQPSVATSSVMLASTRSAALS